MQYVEKYNSLVKANTRHLTLIETLFHEGNLRNYLLRLSKEKIEFMCSPDDEKAFVCVSSADLKAFSKKGFSVIEKDKIKLFGLVEFVADNDFLFAKKIAKKIKNKDLRNLADLIIKECEFECWLQEMKQNGANIIQL